MIKCVPKDFLKDFLNDFLKGFLKGFSPPRTHGDDTHELRKVT